MVHGDKRGSLAVKGGRGTPTAQWGREEPVGRGEIWCVGIRLVGLADVSS
jgi:hypothetical protein